MHPPLDRPHPDCQDEIEALRHCHETRSVFKIWACNEIKHKLDLCFKAEKAKLLKAINKDMHEKRKQEDEAYADAVGHLLSFEEYLNQDPNYLRELKKSEQRDPNQFQKRSTPGMPT